MGYELLLTQFDYFNYLSVLKANTRMINEQCTASSIFFNKEWISLLKGESLEISKNIEERISWNIIKD